MIDTVDDVDGVRRLSAGDRRRAARSAGPDGGVHERRVRRHRLSHRRVPPEHERARRGPIARRLRRWRPGHRSVRGARGQPGIGRSTRRSRSATISRSRGDRRTRRQLGVRWVLIDPTRDVATQLPGWRRTELVGGGFEVWENPAWIGDAVGRLADGSEIGLELDRRSPTELVVDGDRPVTHAGDRAPPDRAGMDRACRRTVRRHRRCRRLLSRRRRPGGHPHGGVLLRAAMAHTVARPCRCWVCGHRRARRRRSAPTPRRSSRSGKVPMGGLSRSSIEPARFRAGLQGVPRMPDRIPPCRTTDRRGACRLVDPDRRQPRLLASQRRRHRRRRRRRRAHRSRSGHRGLLLGVPLGHRRSD